MYLWQLIDYKDIVEILLVSASIYVISLWLSQDKINNLNRYFYSYLSFIIISWSLSFTTMQGLFLLMTPALLSFFFIVHQKQLARNWVALKNLTPKTIPTHDWIAQLSRGLLHYNNNNKQLIVIIEQTDNLESFLYATHEIHARVDNDLFSLFAHDHAIEGLWINHEGFIKGINPQSFDSTETDTMFKQLLQETDCILIYTDTAEQFSMSIGEKNYLHISALEIKRLLFETIKNYPHISHKGINYVEPEKTKKTQPTA